MRKLKSIDELPDWFQIQNYSVFHKLTDKQISHQFEIRALLKNVIQILHSQDNKMPEVGNKLCEHYEKKAFLIPELVSFHHSISTNEIFILDEKTAPEAEKHPDVRPTTYSEAQESLDLAKKMIKMEVEENTQTLKESDFRDISLTGLIDKYNQRSELPSLQSFFGTLILSVNLRGTTDKALIAEFESVLKRARNNLEIPNANLIKYRNGEYKKGISLYHCFPLFDLDIWAWVKEIEIPKRLIASKLWPDGRFGENALTDNIKEYMDKMFAFNYQHKN